MFLTPPPPFSSDGAWLTPTPPALLLQCTAVGSWAEVLGAHQAELSAGVRDEDWGAQQAAGGGGWTLVEVISPSRA